MINSLSTKFLISLSFFLNITILQSQKSDIWSDDNFTGLEFRSIGPALMSGRISDIAIHPEDENEPPPAENDYWRPKDLKLGEREVKKPNILGSLLKAKSKMCSSIHEKRRI